MDGMVMIHEVAPAEIPGLQDAFAAEWAALARRDGIKTRLERAKADHAKGKRDREELVARVASGEDLPGSAMRQVEDRMRDAESGQAMFSEALPAAEADVEAAAEARQQVVWAEIQRRRSVKRAVVVSLEAERDALNQRIEAAQRAFDAEHPQNQPAFVEMVTAARRAAGWSGKETVVRSRMSHRTFTVAYWSGIKLTLDGSVPSPPNVGATFELYDPGNPDYAAWERSGHVEFGGALSKPAGVI